MYKGFLRMEKLGMVTWYGIEFGWPLMRELTRESGPGKMNSLLILVA